VNQLLTIYPPSSPGDGNASCSQQPRPVPVASSHQVMDSSLPRKIAVIGAGLIGRRHIQHVLDEPQTNLVAIVEPTAAGQELASSLGVPCYPSVDNLLTKYHNGEVALDGAIISTPTNTHVQLAIRFVQAGVHVLVEKPVALSAKEGEELVDVLNVSDRKTKVLVGQHRRL
jgi:predicted dehydrogenase